MGDLYDVGAGCELEPVDFQMYRFRATLFLFSSANDRVPIRFLVGAEWDTDGFAPADGSDSDDCAPGLETEPGEDWIRRDEGGAALSALCRLTDYDRDRPSPGDDITRAAFDAMDREA